MDLLIASISSFHESLPVGRHLLCQMDCLLFEAINCSRHFTNTFNNCNLGHNILELCNVLIQTQLTTNKTKRVIWYSKLGIRVASRVANDFRLRILGNMEMLGKSQIWVET